MPERKGLPHEPAEYNNQIVAAIRALHSGTANEGQQKMAFDWIVYRAAGFMDLSYRPGGNDGDRATCFADGKRFVGSQILKMLQPALTPKKQEATAPARKPRRKAKNE